MKSDEDRNVFADAMMLLISDEDINSICEDLLESGFVVPEWRH